jgi:spermidine synthase
MPPQHILARVTAADGRELVLHRRAGIFTIRVDGRELMSNRAHGSEEVLARAGCAGLERVPRPRVLVGGLGMGFTLRAALDVRPGSAEVVVVEVFPAVVAWCRGPLAHLAGDALADARVVVLETDVAELLERPGPRFHAILLDVDNGPRALTMATNDRLYGARGVARLRERLTGGGALAVWSASPDREFEARLGTAGFAVHATAVPARAEGGGPEHTVYVARRE